MTILLFNWRDTKNPKAGGAEVVTQEFAKGWVKKGFRVIWFTSSFRGALRNERVGGVEIVRQGNFITVFLLAPFYYFSHRREIDIVIDEIHGLPFFTPLYVKKPIIAFIHEVAAEIWDYMYPFPINKVGKCMEKFCLRFYRHITFWADAVSTISELHLLGISRNHCVAISLPITNRVIRGLPKKETHSTFIFVSRVVKMKGIEEVIKAFGFILKEDPSAMLWVVGRGDASYVRWLKKMLSGYGADDHVVFWGGVSEEKKLELMRRAHILLHASVKEGWGLVVVEAASQGTPSVVYNVSGLCDSVKHNKTGVVLTDNSPFCMAREALLLLHNKKKYERFQKKGLEWSASLTWDKAVKQSLDLIEKTVRSYP